MAIILIVVSLVFGSFVLLFIAIQIKSCFIVKINVFSQTLNSSQQESFLVRDDADIASVQVILN